MIGVVSHPGDLHATVVRRELDRLGVEHVLLDTGRYPAQAAVTVEEGPHGAAARWVDGGTTIDLTGLRVMWWRRPQPFAIDPGIGDWRDRGFALGECAAAIAGLWACLDAEWVNDPDRDQAASRKLWQLRLARSLGLRVPRTCVTNDPQEAAQFVAAEPTGAVFKPFSATPETWRETRPVRACDVELLDLVRLAPVIFQELIPGGVDLRVTVVGDQVYPAVIRAGAGEYEFDFRVASAPIAPYRLPPQVERRLLALLRRLGLHYGAADFRLAPDGEPVFLEVNPAGQWLFVEYATEQPITAALAGLLAAYSARRRHCVGRRNGQPDAGQPLRVLR